MIMKYNNSCGSSDDMEVSFNNEIHPLTPTRLGSQGFVIMDLMSQLASESEFYFNLYQFNFCRYLSKTLFNLNLSAGAGDRLEIPLFCKN